jgi:ferredoxin-NADP reductase
VDSSPGSVGVPPVGPWQFATVTDIRVETPRVKTFALELPSVTPHVAGQHFVVRLTAPDGYTAQRSYSVASPPGDGTSIELTVEWLPDGEVSTFLHEELQVGDTLEVRGPIGGWFVWDGTTPALLIGGGSGVVPLMAMLRLAHDVGAHGLVHLIVSTRTPAELIYASELESDDTSIVYTRSTPAVSARAAGRITADDIRPHVREDATVYICGSANFANGATERALEAGVDSLAIRVERFGPTG